MAESTYTVSLRVEHPAVCHEEIVQSLGLQPAFAYSAGKPRRTPRGAHLEGINKKTYCRFDLMPKQSGDFIDEIRELIPRLRLHGNYFQTLTKDSTHGVPRHPSAGPFQVRR